MSIKSEQDICQALASSSFSPNRWLKDFIHNDLHCDMLGDFYGYPDDADLLTQAFSVMLKNDKYLDLLKLFISDHRVWVDNRSVSLVKYIIELPYMYDTLKNRLNVKLVLETLYSKKVKRCLSKYSEIGEPSTFVQWVLASMGYTKNLIYFDLNKIFPKKYFGTRTCNNLDAWDQVFDTCMLALYHSQQDFEVPEEDDVLLRLSEIKYTERQDMTDRYFNNRTRMSVIQSIKALSYHT